MQPTVSRRLIAVIGGTLGLALLLGPCGTGVAAQQSQTASGPSTRQAQAPAKAKAAPKTVRLAFRNASVDSVLELYANLHGLAIVKDPSLTAQANLSVAKPLTVDEASTIIEAYLESLGYTISVDNNVARVLPRQGQGGRGSRGGGAGAAPGNSPAPSFDVAGGGTTRAGFGGAGSADVQTRVFAIKYADAQSLARVVNEVYGRSSVNTQQNQPRGMMMPGMGGPFGPQGGPFAAQNYGANVQDAAMLLQTTANQPGTARASYDTYSNSLIVTGTARQLEQIQEMLDQLDIQVNNSTISEVFRLKYADCQQMATVVSGLLMANANGGTQSGALRNTTFEARVFASAVAGPTTATGGQVVAYPENNSLIVTTTPQMMALVRSTISQLDVRPRMQPTTFVYPLRYAWAGDVADILTNMFGRRSGSGTSYTGTTSSTQQARRRLDQMGGGSGGFGGGFGGIGGGGSFGRGGQGGGSYTQPAG